MRILLDTHAFLWWIDDAPEISSRAKRLIADPGTEVLLSLASVWEMAIKISLDKLKISSPLERFVPEQLSLNGFRYLDIDFPHISRVSVLPFHHRDPFDRLLIAQSLEEKLPILSADKTFRQYGVKTIW